MLSIVVPVYNSEKYLERCLQSLVELEVLEKEIILVDDGSTDSSPEILDNWARKYPEMRVFHTANAGPSAARNRGIDAAIGEYLAFVDSDDWIDKDIYRYFLCLMERDHTVDICIAGTAKNFPDGKEQDYFPFKNGMLHTEKMMNSQEALDAMVSKKDFFWFLWGKLYRRALFGEDTAGNGDQKDMVGKETAQHPQKALRLDESVKVSEDLALNWQLFLRARKIYYSDRGGRYHYFMNADSLTENQDVVARNQDDLAVYRKLLQENNAMSSSCYEGFLMRILQRDYVNMREIISQHPGGKEQMLRSLYRELEKYLLLYQPTNRYGESIKDMLSLAATDYNSCTDSIIGVYEDCRRQAESALCKGKRVYFFGLGDISRVMATYLDAVGQEYTGFVVSEEKYRIHDEWLGHPVQVLAEIPEESKILLTLTEKGQQMMADFLSYRSYSDYEYVGIKPVFTVF